MPIGRLSLDGDGCELRQFVRAARPEPHERGRALRCKMLMLLEPRSDIPDPRVETRLAMHHFRLSCVRNFNLCF